MPEQAGLFVLSNIEIADAQRFSLMYNVVCMCFSYLITHNHKLPRLFPPYDRSAFTRDGVTDIYSHYSTCQISPSRHLATAILAD